MKRLEQCLARGTHFASLALAVPHLSEPQFSHVQSGINNNSSKKISKQINTEVN